MNRLGLFAFSAAFLSLLMAGCAADHSAYEKVYASLLEEPSALDQRVLAGKKIVLDPGHGGYFDGATGPDSLREADVNLGVALYLWGLLKDAGADVHMTRTTDKDFLPEPSFELRDDLENRVRISNELEPDVFISIHHNSSFPTNRDRNGIEIYYKSDDHGPSLVLSQDVHLHLSRNLGIDKTEIKPGNYYVLRNSTARASILGEASYLSNPFVEEKLKLSNKQRLEAEAYFMGLVSYFSRGIPSLERISPPSDTISAPTGITFVVTQGGDVPVDPASARITIGGKCSIPFYDPVARTLEYVMPTALPNGAYSVSCMVRSTGGGIATSKLFTLLLSRPAAHILPLQVVLEPGSGITLSVKVLDALGMPIADGTAARARFVESDRVFNGTSMEGTVSFDIEGDSISSGFIVELEEKCDTLLFDPTIKMDLSPMLVLDAVTKQPVPFPSVSSDGNVILRGDSKGRLLIADEKTGSTLIIHSRGYRPLLIPSGEETTRDGGCTVHLHPIYDGILRGRRIALDPAGGGADHGGSGKEKLRGEWINLSSARALAGILKAAGALVSITRSGEETISLQERVYKVNRFRPDLALRIDHGTDCVDRAPECAVLHYPGSSKGKDLARHLADRLASVPPCEHLGTEASSGLFLQQTSCPACEIHFADIGKSTNELLYSKSSYIQLEAESMAAAMLGYLDPAGNDAKIQRIRILSGDKPMEGAAVCMDHVLTKTSDKEGLVSFHCVFPGKHLVSVELRGGKSSLTTIDIVPGTTDTMEILLD